MIFKTKGILKIDKIANTSRFCNEFQVKYSHDCFYVEQKKLTGVKKVKNVNPVICLKNKVIIIEFE